MMKAIKMMMAILIATITFTSCDDKMEIQQSYDFSVETMPVQTKIKREETAEIRCELKSVGDFRETTYTIRYFQPEGAGILKMENGTLFLPNDRYPLEKGKFRLYYTSNTTDSQKIDIYVEDCFGKVKQLSFSFNNDNKEEE